MPGSVGRYTERPKHYLEGERNIFLPFVSFLSYWSSKGHCRKSEHWRLFECLCDDWSSFARYVHSIGFEWDQERYEPGKFLRKTVISSNFHRLLRICIRSRDKLKQLVTLAQLSVRRINCDQIRRLTILGVAYYKTREQQIELERKKMIEREKERQRQAEYDQMLLSNRLVSIFTSFISLFLNRQRKKRRERETTSSTTKRRLDEIHG